jgi:Coenzyme PQQ synthesis protein D (PqqD)
MPEARERRAHEARKPPGMNDRYQQCPTVEAAPLEDGMILLDPETSQFSVLNPTATAIWTSVAKPATSEEIVAEIRARFEEVDGSVVSDVEETLRQMVERKLIKRVEATTT